MRFALTAVAAIALSACASTPSIITVVNQAIAKSASAPADSRAACQQEQKAALPQRYQAFYAGRLASYGDLMPYSAFPENGIYNENKLHSNDFPAGRLGYEVPGSPPPPTH